MTAPESTAYQANFKIGNDLHNVYSTNGADFLDQLDFFQTEALPKILAISSVVHAGATIVTSLPVAPAPQQVFQAAATAAPTGGGEVHLCDHGQPMKNIPAGISKATGKPYAGFYACAQPRGQQCDAKVSTR